MNYYVDRAILGARSTFIYQWENMQMFCGADLQVNKHRRKIMLNWYEDSCFQDMGHLLN